MDGVIPAVQYFNIQKLLHLWEVNNLSTQHLVLGEHVMLVHLSLHLVPQHGWCAPLKRGKSRTGPEESWVCKIRSSDKNP